MPMSPPTTPRTHVPLCGRLRTRLELPYKAKDPNSTLGWIRFSCAEETGLHAIRQANLGRAKRILTSTAQPQIPENCHGITVALPYRQWNRHARLNSNVSTLAPEWDETGNPNVDLDVSPSQKLYWQKLYSRFSTHGEIAFTQFTLVQKESWVKHAVTWSSRVQPYA